MKLASRFHYYYLIIADIDRGRQWLEAGNVGRKQAWWSSFSDLSSHPQITILSHGGDVRNSGEWYYDCNDEFQARRETETYLLR
jgi:hypothetical protein